MAKRAISRGPRRQGAFRYGFAAVMALGAGMPAWAHDPPAQAAVAGKEAGTQANAVAGHDAHATHRAAVKDWNAAYARALKAHLQGLAAQGNARGLLAAALLRPAIAGVDPATGTGSSAVASEGDGWFDAASAVRPRDPLVAWRETTGCQPLWRHCDPAGALAFLLETAGDDMAVHLSALAAAHQRGEMEAAAHHLHAAVQAVRNSGPLVELGRLLLDSVATLQAPAMPPEVAAALGSDFRLNRAATVADQNGVVAMAVWAAQALPAYGPLSSMCRVDADTSAGLRDDCTRIMARLADSPILIEAMLGTVRSVRLAGEGKEAAAWRERLRQLNWTQEQAQHLIMSSTAPLPADYLQRSLRDGEMAAMNALLEASGIPLQAPAGWLPENPRMRGLVLEGREPVAPAPSPPDSAAAKPGAG
ncbi:hypothetical protein GCM10027400_17090 [Pseudoxanthomonas daejeonensis]